MKLNISKLRRRITSYDIDDELSVEEQMQLLDIANAAVSYSALRSDFSQNILFNLLENVELSDGD